VESVGILPALRRRWLLALICCLVVVGAAAGATAAATKTYATTLRAFVSANSADPLVGGPYQGSLLAQSQVQSYAAIVTSPAVTRPVIQQLRLPFRPDQLAGVISTKVPLNTVLIDITVTDKSAIRARDIANAVGTQFASVVRNLQGSAGAPAVNVTVVQPAETPSSPVSPRPVINLLLGLFVGVALGVGAAVLRESLGRRQSALPERVRGSDPDTVVPTLATFPWVPDSEPLAVIDDQALRQLRVNLSLLAISPIPTSLAVTSLAVGNGRSTTCVNLGASMANAGLRVLVVEADAQQPNLSAYLDLDGRIGVTDVLAGDVDFQNALQVVHLSAGNTLHLLPHGTVRPHDADPLDNPRFSVMLRDLQQLADIVLVDAPAVRRDRDLSTVAGLADGVVLVVRHGKVQRDAERVAQAMAQVGANVLGIVVNMVTDFSSQLPEGSTGGGGAWSANGAVPTRLATHSQAVSASGTLGIGNRRDLPSDAPRATSATRRTSE